jgi:preprotein translocase subunit YajC
MGMMTMMRLVMEAVMLIAVVAMIWFMMKISATEDNATKTLREEGDEDQNDSDSP